MNQKEAITLKNDRDYWKNLCSKLSERNVELEEENKQLKEGIKKVMDVVANDVFAALSHLPK